MAHVNYPTRLLAILSFLFIACGSIDVAGGTFVASPASAQDVSPPLRSMKPAPTRANPSDLDEEVEPEEEDREPARPNALSPQTRPEQGPAATQPQKMWAVPNGSAQVEQVTQGTRPPPQIVASFDGLGEG